MPKDGLEMFSNSEKSLNSGRLKYAEYKIFPLAIF
jgi:hypothetical protein